MQNENGNNSVILPISYWTGCTRSSNSDFRTNHMISDHETHINPANMYTTLDISPASEVLLADEAPAITSRKAKSEKSVSGARNLIWIRLTLWDATEMLQGIAGVFAVLYLFGVVALAAAVLFYTFSR